MVNVNEEDKIAHLEAEIERLKQLKGVDAAGGKIVHKGQEYISINVAALESYNVLNGSKNMAIASIAAVIVTAAFGIMGQTAGSVAAGIISMGYALFLYKIISRQKYLATAYNIPVKKSKFNIPE